MTTPPEYWREWAIRNFANFSDVGLDGFMKVINYEYKMETGRRKNQKVPCIYCGRPVGVGYSELSDGVFSCESCEKNNQSENPKFYQICPENVYENTPEYEEKQ